MSEMADKLSDLSVMGEVNGAKTCPMSDRSQRASFEVWTIATYLDSIVDREIISWHFEAHETAPPSMRNV